MLNQAGRRRRRSNVAPGSRTKHTSNSDRRKVLKSKLVSNLLKPVFLWSWCYRGSDQKCISWPYFSRTCICVMSNE